MSKISIKKSKMSIIPSRGRGLELGTFFGTIVVDVSHRGRVNTALEGTEIKNINIFCE